MMGYFTHYKPGANHFGLFYYSDKRPLVLAPLIDTAPLNFMEMALFTVKN